jgi:peptidoglycan/LPS O-acetylase OafA/YrhL
LIAAALLDPPTLRGRSNGIDLLRGWFALHVLVVAHVVNWCVFHQGEAAVWTPVAWLAHAFILVFQGHSELNPAVIGFIVLSGYSIHRNGLRPGGAMAPFAIRRTFRILPVFWLGTVLGVLFYHLSAAAHPATATALTGTTEIPTICLAAKITAIASLLPIAHVCDFAGNAPLLTVMVEIGLYAFYGLIFVVGGIRLVGWACGVSIIVGLGIGAMNLRYPLLYNWWQNSSLLAYLPYWWIGAAVIHPAVRSWIMRWWPALVIVWQVLSVVSAWADPTAVSAELRKLVFAGLAAAMIIRFDEMAMPANPLSSIGKAGYSIYAIHAPIAIYLVILGLPWWAVSAVAIAAGLASYLAFEHPLDMIGHQLARGAGGAVRASLAR